MKKVVLEVLGHDNIGGISKEQALDIYNYEIKSQSKGSGLFISYIYIPNNLHDEMVKFRFNRLYGFYYKLALQAAIDNPCLKLHPIYQSIENNTVGENDTNGIISYFEAYAVIIGDYVHNFRYQYWQYDFV